MLEVLAARNYFETHGSFTEIRHDLGRRVADMSEEDLYASIGFKPYKNFSGKQIFVIRKLYLQGNVEEALKKSNCADEKHLLEFLAKSYNQIFKENSSEAKVLEYAEIMASYILKSVIGIYSDDPHYKAFVDMLNQIRISTATRDNPLKLNKDDGKGMQNLYRLLAPAIRVVKGVEPKVVGGYLYIPEKLTKKEEKELEAFCIANLILNTIEVPAQMVVNYRSIGLGYNFTDLLDSSNVNFRNIYTYMFDLALAKDITLEEILASMGFNIVHFWRQYKETKCMFTLANNDSVLVKFESGERVLDFKLFLQHYQSNTLLKCENRR